MLLKLLKFKGHGAKTWIREDSSIQVKQLVSQVLEEIENIIMPFFVVAMSRPTVNQTLELIS